MKCYNEQKITEEQSMEEVVFVTPPYDFDRVLERLSMDPLNAVNREARAVKIPFYELGEVIEVKAIGTTKKPEFQITYETDQDIEKKKSYIYDTFQWHTPLDPVSQHFNNTVLKEIFEEHKGTPLVLEFDYFATLIKSIIHQQLNLSFAHTLTERFVQKYGEQKNGVWFYPRPEIVAEIPIEELRELQFSQRKGEYAIGLAKEIVSGELDLVALSKEADEDVMKRLVKIRGIGPWTAESFLMFGLGRPNLFPKADMGIQNALKILHNMDRKPTKEEMSEWATEWEPYLSYASLYLWRSIEKQEVKK